MNKNGGMFFYLFMLGLTIAILALALAPAVQDFTSDAMNPSSANMLGMDCDNASISNFDKAACLVTDLNLFYFIGGLLFIAGAVVVSRVVF